MAFQVYPLAPIFMLLGWNPFFYWFIGSGIGPSLFVSYAYLQITATIGGYACAWPSSVKSVLEVLNFFNFDFNLLFLDCWLSPTYTMKWILFELLPVFYACYYFGGHYVNKWRLAMSPESEIEVTPWNMALKAALFLLNILYLAVTGMTLQLFMCLPLGNTGTYYLATQPSVLCHTGEHLALTILSMVPLLCYAIAWPMAMTCIFYVGQRKALLDEAKYASVFGFLYKRYEIQWYWWHQVVVLHKGLIVLTKVFFFDSFWQAPAGFAVSTFIVLAQAYARPFESSKLDRLQTLALWGTMVYCCAGILFSTSLGQTEQQPFIAFQFLSFFLLTLVVCLYYVAADIARYRTMLWIMRLSKMHELNINPKHIVCRTFAEWCSRDSSVLDFEMFRRMQSTIAKYPIPPHMRKAYLLHAKGAPELLSWLCWPVDYEGIGFCDTYRACFDTTCDPDTHTQLEFTPTFMGVVSFVIQDYHALQENRAARSVLKQQSFLGRDNEFVALCFKELAHGVLLHALLSCTDEERKLISKVLCRVAHGLDPEWNDTKKPLHCSLTANTSRAEKEEMNTHSEDGKEVLHEEDNDEGEGEAVGQHETECLEDAEDEFETVTDEGRTIDRLFSRYDLDGSGSISSAEELGQLVTNLLVTLDVSLPTGHLDNVLGHATVAIVGQPMGKAAFREWWATHIHAQLHQETRNDANTKDGL